MTNTIDRKYEKFIGGPTPSPREVIRVTLNRKGIFYFNEKAHRMMGRPQYVYLYFNREADRIAIEQTQSPHNTSFPVRQKLTGYMIYAAPFCSHFRIQFEGTHRFVSPDIDAAGRMYLKLAETVQVNGRPKKRKK